MEARYLVDSAQTGASTAAARGRAAEKGPVVYLHIGAPKTGTTYLQGVLWRNRARLREDGVLYPGHRSADHVHAAFDLRGAGFHGYQHPAVPGAWPRIVDEVRAWGGTALISQELFSPATRDQVDQAMSALSFAEVHLVYTARDLVRQIPAAWQEDVKNRHVLRFDEFLRSLREPEESRHHLGTAFWRMQDAVEVLDRWGHALPPERVHVVTVPPPDAPAGTLWDRFARLIGLDPSRYETAPTGANVSLGGAEATMLRRLNLALDSHTPWPVYSQFVKHYLAEEVLAQRPEPYKIALPAEEHPWVVERSKDLVAGVHAAGYHVVGDLEELIPSPAPASAPTTIDDPPAEAQLEAALESMAGLLGRVARLRESERKLREDLRELETRRRQPLKTVVRDLSHKYPVVMRARERWWHTVERVRRIRVSRQPRNVAGPRQGR